ncbi:MAG TPA: 50S ribosomal protein L5 [Nitrospinota bacterium]|jgi:large subunit ribosomal protein L5|nr:50S ribosomal protein L5 [Nitrospinota bacterium]|tara:strand:+ start:1781 stop:2335 length:555 start_codon:yes stop_codon:yes gene_type:complete
MARLIKFYQEKVVPQLRKDFNYKNINQVPRFKKIVLNIGLGEATQNAKIIDSALEQLKIIAGQKPVITKAKKSISNFKLKEGSPIGVSVILRRKRMYEFYDRLVNVALPRVRDFRGVSEKGFDGRGNYTMGIKEQLIFPEIHYDMIEKILGMNITIVTDAKSNEEGKSLLKLMGMPFRIKKQDG